MTFDRTFHWLIRNGARILVAAAILFTIAAVLTGVSQLALMFGFRIADTNSSVTTYTSYETLFVALLAPFMWPLKLLFFALIVNNLDRWAAERRDGSL